MASPKTEQARRQGWHDELARFMRNRENPRAQLPRDRSLRGKARIRARKLANRQETQHDA